MRKTAVSRKDFEASKFRMLFPDRKKGSPLLEQLSSPPGVSW